MKHSYEDEKIDCSGAQKHVKLRQNVFFKSASPFPLKKNCPQIRRTRKTNFLFRETRQHTQFQCTIYKIRKVSAKPGATETFSSLDSQRTYEFFRYKQGRAGKF